MPALLTRKKPAPPPPGRPRAIVASAARLDLAGGQTWKAFRGGGARWQDEAWYQYDICGELRYAVGWIGNACSQATLYAADVDPDTGRPSQPTDNQVVQDVAEGILGGPVQRSQALRTMAVNIAVPGEVFILLRSGTGRQPDRWIVLSTSEISGSAGGIEYTDPDTGDKTKVAPQDLLIRVWSPHPRLQRAADSPIRALLPSLREIERSSQNVAARLDSRLASAGLLLLPEEVDFPRGDDDPPGPEGFMKMLARAMAAALGDPGNASSQVPITIEVPGEWLDKIRHLSFETPVSSEVVELREKAIGRLATGMDLPAEMLTGLSQGNHWSAWQVEEATYKTHIAPLLDRIADALTQAYLLPALTAAGVEDPERYMLAFDATDLVARPNRLADMTALHERAIVSDDALATTGGVSQDERPGEDEVRRRLLERLVLADPGLLADPAIAAALGLTPTQVPAADGPEPAGGDQPAPDDIAQQGPPEQQDTVTAAGHRIGLAVDVADVAVLHALERVGGRLVNSHRLRGQYADVPKHELHTVIPAPEDRLPELTADLWRFCRQLADEYDLTGYVSGLLRDRAPHTPESLRAWMVAGGIRSVAA